MYSIMPKNRIHARYRCVSKLFRFVSILCPFVTAVFSCYILKSIQPSNTIYLWNCWC